ncbi:pentapeptide repeat-containing protein [candidate division KSB1 bacterium]|nr:pentapeptide repeat-containing protein [candidate division KSB1 bacterium]
MANENHLNILKQGVPAWNKWREKREVLFPNLRKANLAGLNLSGAVLRDVYLRRANLSGADLSHADLREANLSGANLSGANLSHANLAGANLRAADLYKAVIQNANLMSAILVDANLKEAEIRKCQVYGISAWKIDLTQAIQADLIVTHPNEPSITVDSLEIAQFIHLLLRNQKIRQVIDTITSKVVLILGRFTPERKAILDQLREALHQRDFVPVLFDFEKPSHRDLSETISTLAHMARFIIADLSDARSLPQELQLIIPDLPSVPVQPILHASAQEYGMFEHFKRYPWVLDIFRYQDFAELLKMLDELTIPRLEKGR